MSHNHNINHIAINYILAIIHGDVMEWEKAGEFDKYKAIGHY